MNISAIILTKNDEKMIGTVLTSLAWTDERIVIDNGSDDGTASVAKKSGVRIDVVKEKDFSLLRNTGARLAKGEWLLYIDTDEEVSDLLKKEILQTVERFDPDKDPHAYVLQRKNYYLGSYWPFSDGMIRLIYKPSLKRWFGKLHETAEISGSLGTLKQPLIHRTHRTLEEMVEQTNEWSDIEAELRTKGNHPPVVPWRLFRVMLTAFVNSYIKQGGWKAGTVGLIESTYQAFSMFITYAKLWEKQQGN